MASASPVTILTATPISACGGDGGRRVVARRVEQRQHADELPVAVAVGAGHTQGPEAADGEIVDGLVGGRSDLCGVGGQRQDDLRGAFGDPERRAVGGGDGGLGAFVHRVERLELGDRVIMQSLGVREAAKYREVDGIVVVRAGGQRAVADHGRRADAVDGERGAQRQGILRQGAGLVRAQNVHPGEFLDGHQPAHDGLFLGQQPCPDGHRHRQHGGHRHRDRGDGQDQGELQRGQDRVTA